MGLDTFKGGADSDKSGIKWSKDKLHKDHLCPRCGSDNTEKVHYYWRCNEPSDKCPVVTYIKTTR